MRLLNKVAIVTGANSGMGMATARALLDEGATVIMLCRNEKRGKEAYSKLTADGNSRTYLILCDLGDYKSIRSFVKQVKDISGEYFYKCRIAKSSKRSKDMELAKKLYEFTEELIK